MKIEIVTHCYSAIYPHYAQALTYQLSSFCEFPPRQAELTVSVCCCASDQRTHDVLDYFQRSAAISFHLRREIMDECEIGRRSIGRNRIALRTPADIVWFADVDQCYRENILDRLAATSWPEATMIFPREIMIHINHATGDKVMNRADSPRLVFVDPAQFEVKRYTRAIGGVQIVRGEFARTHGYLPSSERFQRPAKKAFGDFRDDVAYRQFCKSRGRTIGVDLPGLYRLRHSVTSYQ